MARFVYFYGEEVAVNIDAVVKVVFGEHGTAIHTTDGNYILLHDEGEAEAFKQHLMENVYHDNTRLWGCARPPNEERCPYSQPYHQAPPDNREAGPYDPWGRDDEDASRHQETREEATRWETGLQDSDGIIHRHFRGKLDWGPLDQKMPPEPLGPPEVKGPWGDQEIGPLEHEEEVL